MMNQKLSAGINAEIVLRVNDLARGGAGVCREPSGRVVFVPYTAPGDLVRVRITESDRRYAQAELLEVLEASPDRWAPRCPVFGQCGGCQWQHLPYSLQWETKSKGVLESLKRVEITPSEPLVLIPAEQVWEYRNRVQLRGEKKELGFFKSGSQELVPVDRCDIARPELNESWEVTRSQGDQNQSPYKVEVQVNLSGQVTRTWNSPHSADGFRQVHDEQNEKMRNWIFSQIQGNEVLYDLFGGLGNLSLPLIERMKEIHCVDLAVPSVRPLSLSPHYHFHQSPVVPWLVQRAGQNKGKKEGPPGSAIIDPPRKGLGSHFPKIATALEALDVRELVLVGCDSDSWARDLSQWIKRGWKLHGGVVIDLFPQTYHVEAVGVLFR